MRYWVLVWLCAAAALAYVQRQSLGVAEQTIRGDLHMADWQMAWVQSAFFISYALLQIPTGRLVQVRGTRLALPIFAVVFSVFSAACGLAGGALGFILARLGMGAGQAGIFPASTNSIARWFPRTQWAFPNGALLGFMQVGGALGSVLTGILLVRVGWRWLFALYSLPALAWAAGFYAWFRNTPQEHPGVDQTELSTIRGGASTEDAMLAAPPRRTPWRLLVTSRPMICICAQQFCRAAAGMFFASWFATYLKATRHVSIELSGILTGLPVLATAIGSLLGGVVSDWVLVRTGSRRLARQWLSVASMLICAALIASAFFVEDAWLAVGLISAGSLVQALASACAYAITIDMGAEHRVAVFSASNMCGNIGTAVFPHLVPPIVKATGSWDLVLFLFAGFYGLAALFWAGFDPSGTLFDRAGSTHAAKEG